MVQHGPLLLLVQKLAQVLLRVLCALLLLNVPLLALLEDQPQRRHSSANNLPDELQRAEDAATKQIDEQIGSQPDLKITQRAHGCECERGRLGVQQGLRNTQQGRCFHCRRALAQA